MELEHRIAMESRFSTEFDTHKLGAPSGYICPDCNGSPVSVREGNFRCHVGHAWTAEALLTARDDEVEGALWVAVRSLPGESQTGPGTGRQDRTRTDRPALRGDSPGSRAGVGDSW